MTLEIVIPESNAKNRTTKDLVFSILLEDKPKTLTQLHRGIKAKYGKSVSFQAVIKAVNSLLSSKVLAKDKKLYSISKDWVFETRKLFDKLYREYFKVKQPIEISRLSNEITVYKVSNLLELDKLWGNLLFNWAKNENKDKRNAWSGRHCWWLMPHLQEEDELHDFFSKKGIKTYNLLSENTLLDKISAKYYKDKKENTKIKKSKESTGKNISAFGEFIVKFEIPKNISKKLDSIYQKTKKLESLKLKDILDIFKENLKVCRRQEIPLV